MALQTSSGVRYYIAPAEPATYDKVGFDALAWEEVNEVSSVSAYGAQVTEVNFTNLKDAILKKFKGTVNFGSMSIEMGYDSSDAGQLAMDSGVSGANQYVVHSHKVEYPDGTIDAFTGYLFGYDKNPGAIDNVITSTGGVGINTRPIDIQ